MKQFGIILIFLAGVFPPAEVKAEDPCSSYRGKFPPFKWNTKIAPAPSSQVLMNDKKWDLPNAIKPTEAMARIRAIKVRYNYLISSRNSSCKGGLQVMNKDSVTITMTPMAGGYVSLARAWIDGDGDYIGMKERAEKYGAGLEAGSWDSSHLFIKNARMAVSPIHPGDEFGFDYGANNKTTKSNTTTCRFGNTSHGSVIGIKGNITDVACSNNFQHSGDSGWQVMQGRYWLLNEFGVFIPQVGTIKEELQMEGQEGLSKVHHIERRISGLSVEIIR